MLQYSSVKPKFLIEVGHKQHARFSPSVQSSLDPCRKLSKGEMVEALSSSLRRCFLVGRLGFLPFHLALFSLEEVGLDPARLPWEPDVDVAVCLCDRVHSLLYALGVPSGYRWLFPGVGGLVYALPVGQADLVLVFRTNYARLVVNFL